MIKTERLILRPWKAEDFIAASASSFDYCFPTLGLNDCGGSQLIFFHLTYNILFIEVYA